MGVAHSATNEQKKEKVERLFRQNIRSSRSRSLDCRNDRPARPVGGSHSARYPKTRCRLLEDGGRTKQNRPPGREMCVTAKFRKEQE
ncbi:hypothetical protein NECAME_12079 [Necator americanus]|uniref:Uncharacterized protein n=1 Tax=Necator americanus TaxID=51031 RepID=W2T1N2_NECAM|nr:hypothetical protein NECAME_12079 [Necator americanus]ETN75905.1 hypothetical protein NECAME_12079 [Necator americanus]